MKKKLCPFDKKECAGDSCMVFCEETGSCGLVISKLPGEAVVKDIPTKGGHDKVRKEASEKKSKFRAELFD